MTVESDPDSKRAVDIMGRSAALRRAVHIGDLESAEAIRKLSIKEYLERLQALRTNPACRELDPSGFPVLGEELGVVLKVVVGEKGGYIFVAGSSKPDDHVFSTAKGSDLRPTSVALLTVESWFAGESAIKAANRFRAVALGTPQRTAAAKSVLGGVLVQPAGRLETESLVHYLGPTIGEGVQNIFFLQVVPRDGAVLVRSTEASVGFPTAVHDHYLMKTPCGPDVEKHFASLSVSVEQLSTGANRYTWRPS